MQQDIYYKVPFISISATSITEFKRTLNLQTGQFIKPFRINEKGERTEIKPPVFEYNSGNLTEKAHRRLKRSVYNFMTAINKDMLITGAGKENISFVTLTLPSSQIQGVENNQIKYYATDMDIKSKSFNQFMTEIKQQYGIKLFIWKCEKQYNGNLHFHLLLDKQIKQDELKNIWNRNINKFGFVERYHEKMSKLTFEQYKELRKKEKKSDEKLLKAYNYGKETNWMCPNSVDVAEMKKVNSVASYVAKYISKPDDKEIAKQRKYKAELQAKYDLNNEQLDKLYLINGRIWQCSQSISKSRRIVEYLEESYRTEINHVINTVKDIKVHADDFFTTVCMNFKTLKQNMTTIYETYISNIQNVILLNNFISNKPVNRVISFSPVDSFQGNEDNPLFRKQLKFTFA